MKIAREKNWLDIVRVRFEHPATVLWRAVELRLIDNLLSSYALNAPMLDLGCAEGHIADILFEGRSIFGLDNCWELLRKNKSRVYNLLVLGDACRLPYKNQAFGSVFSNCVIEHIPDMESLLNEVARVLKERGVFLFTVPSHKFADFLFFTRLFKRLGLNVLAGWYKKVRNKKLNHFHLFDHHRWKELLKEKGLNVLEHRYYMPEAATSFWDFLAAVVLCSWIFLPLRLFLKASNKSLKSRLDKYYNMSSQEGSGLLIIAQKGD